MSMKRKTALAAGFVGFAALAVSLFGPAGSFAQSGTSTPEMSPTAAAGRVLDQQTREARRSRRAATAEARDGCGRPGNREGQERKERYARRLVHSETKVQTQDGFATLIADRGTITAVDAATKTVTIKRADDATVTVTAQDRTKICRNGEPATIGDLKVGDQAGIMQAVHGEEHRVRAIRAHSPEQAEAAAP